LRTGGRRRTGAGCTAFGSYGRTASSTIRYRAACHGLAAVGSIEATSILCEMAAGHDRSGAAPHNQLQAPSLCCAHKASDQSSCCLSRRSRRWSWQRRVFRVVADGSRRSSAVRFRPGGANAANMFVDRDIDAVMHRTAPADCYRSGHSRPLRSSSRSSSKLLRSFSALAGRQSLLGLSRLAALSSTSSVYLGADVVDAEHRHRRPGRGQSRCSSGWDGGHRPVSRLARDCVGSR